MKCRYRIHISDDAYEYALRQQGFSEEEIAYLKTRLPNSLTIHFDVRKTETRVTVEGN